MLHDSREMASFDSVHHYVGPVDAMLEAPVENQQSVAERGDGRECRVVLV